MAPLRRFSQRGLHHETPSNARLHPLSLQLHWSSSLRSVPPPPLPFPWKLTPPRCRIRFPRQSSPRFPPLVPNPRLPDLSYRAALRPLHPKPTLPGSSIRFHRSRLRLPLRLLPLPSCRSLRGAWLVPELGSYDLSPRHQWEYLQSILWDCI